ncbi:MAG: tetratricopeptide repeat protein [Candidatus Marinimicrobia bacterium]|nr:tetratricopeptide repeat protein [Candidatus Neomarinimicrobiota bacterium]
MTCKQQICPTARLIFTISLFVFSSCAYFNTFYNAQLYFEKAEKERLEKAGESIPPAAIDAYGKVIEKSQHVIDKYPDSKYVQEARLLIGKARFHRKEYRVAETLFNQYTELYSDDVEEAEFWLALCKWKLGKPQPALDVLQSMLNASNDNDFISKIHLAIAEIYLETDEPGKALEHLVLAAETNNDRDERGQIYFRIADLAYSAENFEQALKANEEVVKNTTSKKRKEEANLQIVRIHRLLGNWDKVKSLIKSMLLDDIYASIHGDLELELVKLYQMDNQIEEAITRIETIKEDYKNSKTSAEAYFIHGEISLYDQWNLVNAEKYFGQVTREYRQSSYTSTANLRAKEITEYQESLTEISSLEESNSQIVAALDTLENDSLKQIKKEELQASEMSISNHLYNLGELDAFHFKRQDSSLVHFQRIVDDFPESDFYPKSLFVLYYIHFSNENEESAELYSKRILGELPSSEYADYLRKALNLPVDPESVQAMLRQGELEWLVNPSYALTYYRNIIQKESQSETAARAAYFLAYHYDYTFFEQDSALKYYSWLNDNYNDSEQADASRDRYSQLSQLVIETKKDTLSENPVFETKKDSLFNQEVDEKKQTDLLDKTVVKTKRDSLVH